MPIPGDNPQLDAETRVPILIGMSVAFVTLSTVVVLLRLYTRYFVVCAPGPDDHTIAFAQILSIGVSAATILREFPTWSLCVHILTLFLAIEAKFDLGKHVWMVKPENSMKQLKVCV